mmetsp:Transcript_37002/g.96906  ORF Transcript_37002/g.96906 Transcript_37002/m.96906 type:complete len:210 (+) Transcript_37002:1166-1795(+)
MAWRSFSYVPAPPLALPSPDCPAQAAALFAAPASGQDPPAGPAGAAPTQALLRRSAAPCRLRGDGRAWVFPWEAAGTIGRRSGARPGPGPPRDSTAAAPGAVAPPPPARGRRGPGNRLGCSSPPPAWIRAPWYSRASRSLARTASLASRGRDIGQEQLDRRQRCSWRSSRSTRAPRGRTSHGRSRTPPAQPAPSQSGARLQFAPNPLPW